MRILLLFIILLLVLTACSSQNGQNTNANSNLKESNKPNVIPTSSQARQVDLPPDASEVVSAVTRLQQAGQAMQSLRTDSKLKECGELMRKYRKEIDALEPKSKALSKPYSTYLPPAVIELKTCTSCASNAFEGCIKVGTNIADLTDKLLEK